VVKRFRILGNDRHFSGNVKMLMNDVMLSLEEQEKLFKKNFLIIDWHKFFTFFVLHFGVKNAAALLRKSTF